MNCPYCGRFNAAEDALFCNYCGVRFSDYQYNDQQSAQLQYQAPAQDQSAYYNQQAQTSSNDAYTGQGGEGQGYNWDNFTKFLNNNTKPKEKPTSGKCGKCGSTNLEFYDSGIGTCYGCGKEFRWDGASKPQRPAKTATQQAVRSATQQAARPAQQPATRQSYQQPKAPTYQQPAAPQVSREVSHAPYQVQGPSRDDQNVVAMKQKQRTVATYVQVDAPTDDVLSKEHQREEETYMEWTDEDDKLFAMEESEAKEAAYEEPDDEGPVNDIKAYIEKDLTQDDEEIAAIEKMIKLKHLLKTGKITEYEYKWWEKKIKGA